MLELPTWLVVVGVTGITLGFFFTRFREGTNKAESQALSLAKDTVEFLKEKVSLLEKAQKDNADEIVTLKQENARLSGENARLTDLVMGNEVPTALQEFLSAMHRDTQDRIEAAERHMVEALGSMTHAFSEDLRGALRGEWDGTERREE